MERILSYVSTSLSTLKNNNFCHKMPQGFYKLPAVVLHFMLKSSMNTQILSVTESGAWKRPRGTPWNSQLLLNIVRAYVFLKLNFSCQMF